MRATVGILCVLVAGCGADPTYVAPDAVPHSIPAAPDASGATNPLLDGGSNAGGADAGGGSTAQCATDADCGSDVCSAMHECAPASTLRTFTLKWSVYEKGANASSCSDAILEYVGVAFGTDSTPTWPFQDVWCREGRLVVKNVPPTATWINVGLRQPGLFSDDYVLRPFEIDDRESLSVDVPFWAQD